MLERKVVRIWQQEADVLSQHASALKDRADRLEAQTVAGLSLDGAALKIVAARERPIFYIDLYNILKHGQAAGMNVVRFYYAMRQSPLVRMNGTHVTQRKV